MENITERSAKQSESHGRHVNKHDLPESFKPVIFKQGQNPFNTIEEQDSKKIDTYKGFESNSDKKIIFNDYKRTYLTQKEIILNEVLANIPKENINEAVNKIETDKGEVKIDDEVKEETDKGENEKEEEVSGLNPKTEIITEKDPDEIIILPNEELKKSLNKKNRNQPL